MVLILRDGAEEAPPQDEVYRCEALTNASSLRKQGPITTGGCDLRKSLYSVLQRKILGVWVPAFAGTTLSGLMRKLKTDSHPVPEHRQALGPVLPSESGGLSRR